MTIKNNRITITRDEIQSANLNSQKVAELEEALILAGYELIVENGK